MKRFFIITTRYMCCGIITTDDKVTDYPPIVKWMRGRHIDDVTAWVEKRGTIKELTNDS